METILLYCKSYHKDVYRARRLAESVQRFCQDGMPLIFSVPARDLPLFEEKLAGLPCTIIADEEILARTREQYGTEKQSFPKHLYMQLTKLEFWRMGMCRNYVIIDSDAYFIRHFSRADFMSDRETPLTIRHDSSELREFAVRSGNNKILHDLENQSEKVRAWFNRPGSFYDFGPCPYIFSVKVFESLSRDYLLPNRLTMYDLLQKYAPEAYLYGEYLEHCKAIPIIPSKPLFRVFHYAEQFFEAQMKGESEYSWAKEYLGVVIQSNWAWGPDDGNKKRGSSWLRRILGE